jgi:ZIP family zinc transporter
LLILRWSDVGTRRRIVLRLRAAIEGGAVATWLVAGAWGWLSGSALLIGAALGWFLRLPVRMTAAVMSFGSGVLISALSFDLMDEAQRNGGLLATAVGFVGGAAVYSGLNWALAHYGAKHRKRSGDDKQPSEQEQTGSGMAIALGALLDGIPESIVIGTTMLAGGNVSAVAVVAIFISNLPEGLSSSIGMKKAGRSLAYVMGLWFGIAFLCGLAAMLGYAGFQNVDPGLTATITAVAAGAMLAMLVDTMIPEAFAETHTLAGLITVIGFLCAFTLSKLDERASHRSASEPAPRQEAHAEVR